MTQRRQAPHAGKPAATSFFPTLILIFFFTPPSVLTQADPAPFGALLFLAISAITLASWHCYRRDDTSPRRVGRRI